MKTRYFRSKRYILAFSSLLVSVGSILMSVSISSCSSPSVKNPLLLCADSLMEIHPDSALSILESITNPQKMARADRALYALLLTQARHKNYIALENDSLIKTAVDYYGNKKKSVRAAKAHYYWGATYRELGYTSFAVEEYLTAIRLMPVRDEFLAMIYDNLAECYAKDGMDNVAMEAYRSAYQILEGGSAQVYPLRGIAGIFLSQNERDSALYYYQQALDCALVMRDSSMIGAIYHDFAIVYNEEKDYTRADQYISKAIMVMEQYAATNAFLFKAKIMLNLNKLDSASYFFSKNIDQLNIYGKAVCYDGMYQIAKRRGEWKTATENMDAYKILYDSIQLITDNEELNRLMDKHQLEEHKRLLSEHTRTLIFTLVATFFFLMVMCIFYFMLSDRKRKKHYIALQHELTQKRVDTILLKEEAFESNIEDLNKKRSELTEQQIQLCISVLKTTDCYDQLETFEKATPKQLLAMRSLRKDIRTTISNAFVDVMENLKERCPALTSDDMFYCVLSLLCCSRTVIMELMDATSDALKTRKNRIKNKVDEQIFERMFGPDNQ